MTTTIKPATPRTERALHIDHRIVICSVVASTCGRFKVLPIRDAGASKLGFNGTGIREKWSMGKPQFMTHERLAMREYHE